MALKSIGGDIQSQDLNDNFSYLESTMTSTSWAPFVKPEDYGAVGDGSIDDTAAIDSAIVQGKVLFLSEGKKYVYNGAQSTLVPVIGAGVVIGTTGDPHNKFATKVLTTQLLSNNLSYLGFVNQDYTGDNGTRVYIMPKDAVTTGAGGVMKIFGDAYHLGQDYRDFGIYFYADQNNGDTGTVDKGSNGNGVFWLNQKVFFNGKYDGANPDIGFSFQDGEFVAGRFALVNGKSAFIVGPDVGKFVGGAGEIGLEVQRDAVIYNDKMLRFENNAGEVTTGIRYNNQLDLLELLINAYRAVEYSDNKVSFFNSIVQGYVGVTGNSGTLDVSKGNVFVTGNTAATAISAITNGDPGQRITIIFNDLNTSISNNASITLKGGAPYSPSSLLSSIELMRLGSSWVEVNRTDI